MSADEELSDRDSAVLSEASRQSGRVIKKSKSDTDALRETVTSHQRPTHQAIGELQDELEHEKEVKRELVSLVNDLQSKVEGDNSLTGRTTLEKYSSMSPEDREDLLSTSERRAVDIYEHWDELAWTTQKKELMETQARANAKNQPSKIKYRLEKHFDKSLQANEIYRAMKAVARLSGGEESTDTNGRTNITGGDFEYRVLPTADNSGTRRALERVER